MGLDEAEAEIERAIHHLDDTGNRETPIEALLTNALLVYVCGIYEKEIRRVVTSRARESGDTHLVRFVGSALDRRRHLKLEDLRGEILKKFGEEYLEEFNKRIKGTTYEMSYSNIITNRDCGAHGKSTNMTIDELKTQQREAQHVLAAFSDVLCRSRHEPQ